MGSNGAKEDNGDLLKLYDWKIRRVKDGLDKTEVVDIIRQLVDQRDQLIERTDHLSSLTRLAEKTIAGADELAKQLEAEATQRADAKAANILADAEKQVQELVRENQRIQVEFKKTIDELCRQLISEPQSFTQRIQTLWTESENRLSELDASTRLMTTEATSMQANPPDSPGLEENALYTAGEEESEKTTDSPISSQLKDELSERSTSEEGESNSAEEHNMNSDPSTPPIWRDTSWH
jgi:paraquat-inducible protein B